MYFGDVELENFGPFRGTHRIELGQGEFGVVGEWDHDPSRRSNFAGKSWALASLFFLLTGELPEECRYENDWITEDEKYGSVTGILEHAGEPILKIKRERRGGAPMVLAARPGDDPAAQDAAELVIRDVVGIEPRELFVTWFARQKEISRFVTARPDARAQIVSDWFPELEKLRVAERSVNLSGAADDLAIAKGRLEDARATLGGQATAESIREQVDRLKVEHASLAAARDESERALAELFAADGDRQAREAAVRQLEQDKARHVDLKETIQELEEELAELPPAPATDSHAEEMAAGQVFGTAETEAETARTVARGEFDGTCPVSGGTCPIREDINRSGEAARRRLKVAEDSLSKAKGSYQDAIRANRDAQATERARTRIQANLEAGRAQSKELAGRIEKAWAAGVRSLPGETDRAEALIQARRTRDAARAAVDESSRAIVRLEAMAIDAERAREKVTKLEAEVAALSRTVEVRRLARLALGPGGAQKDFVEGRLLRVEAASNAIFREAGIEQSVGLRWGRQIQGLANHCAACGHPFPKRQGAKICERCGAERGPKVAQELDVRIAHRSGGGDDLAGLVVRIGAAAWLTSRRGSRWSSFVVDEPHGALDQAHRDAVFQVLNGLSRGMLGVKADQVICVSHASDVIARMPRRIVVTARKDGTGSSVRVVG